MTDLLARRTAVAAAAVLAVAVLFLPWYALGDYVPNGWDATWFARLALIAAVAGAIVIRAGGSARVAAALWLAALVLVALRVAVPPDFGFDFAGLEVPVERRIGVWVGFATALAGAATAVWAARARPAGAPAPAP